MFVDVGEISVIFVGVGEISKEYKVGFAVTRMELTVFVLLTRVKGKLTIEVV